MIEFALVNEIKSVYRESQIYFIIKTKDYIVINNEYKGIIVFDVLLNKVNEYTFESEVVIEDGFSDYNRNRIVILSEDKIWYIDLETGYRIFYPIDLESHGYYLSSYYKFKRTEILLYTSHLMIRWNFIVNRFEIFNLTELRADELVEYTSAVRLIQSSHGTCFIDKTWIAYHETLFFYKNGRLAECKKIDASKWYKFDLTQKYFIAVDEFLINIGCFYGDDYIQRITFDRYVSCRGAILSSGKDSEFIILLLKNENNGTMYLRSYQLKGQPDKINVSSIL